MKITDSVIEDLMPMYLANEVSNDTRILIDEYLKSNPRLAEKYKQLDISLTNNIEIPLNKEDQLQAFIKAKKLQTIRILGLAVISSVVFLAILAAVMLLIKL